jgi:hypothetical protein
MERDYEWHVGADGVAIERCWANVRAGLIPWDALDDEELQRGQLRTKHGNFAGGVPTIVPRDLRREQAKRLKDKFDEANLAALMPARLVIEQIAAGDGWEIPAKVQLDAARYIIERSVGKVPDKVELTAEVKPWEGIIGKILVDDPEPLAEHATT